MCGSFPIGIPSYTWHEEVAQIGVFSVSPCAPSHPVVASAYVRAAIACASSAASGQDGGISAMPSR
jgi:hypothetical protein